MKFSFSDFQFTVNLRWILAAGTVCLFGLRGQADEFKLKDGRTLVGQLTSAPKGDAKQWTIQLANGVYVRFDNELLSTNGHIKTEERIERYRLSLENVEPNADSHSALAAWCKANGLKEQAEAHYRRALDFDTDFAPARRELGFVKDEGGRWVERDLFMTESKGKVKVNGRFVYSEVHAFEQQKKELTEKTGQWNVTITRLHREVMANKASAAKALGELQQINDPMAIPAIGAKLLDPKTRRELQLVYVQLLSQFQTLDAVGELIKASIVCGDIGVRDACLDSLATFGREYAIAAYVGKIRAYSSREQVNPNTIVEINRAAMGLNALKADNAVLPLIDALVTQLKVTRKSQSNYNSSGAFTAGEETRTTIEPSQNQEVLSALAALTSQNFGFDEKRWRAWYAATYASPMGDLRRDP